MTDEEINKRIAEYCGWTTVGAGHGFPAQIVTPGGDTRWLNPTPIPGYCTDLNEMHEAVVALPREIQRKYVINLIEVVQNYGIDMRDIVNATARQRAEAFLRTVGKWEDK